jgi:NADPH2 dehydrogenase
MDPHPKTGSEHDLITAYVMLGNITVKQILTFKRSATMSLFSELTIKDMNLKNRIVMPPMCMYSAADGLVNDFHLNHYTTRAMGGAGLIMIEATGVTMNGRISRGDLGLWSDEQVEGMSILVDKIHSCGAKVGIQLSHAGRKSAQDFARVMAPSAIPFSDMHKVPDEMSKSDIEETVYHFGKAVKRAIEAGFDMVEIHGAHGYLINEFLSPLTNIRTDEYGGSIKNRTRFLAQVLTEVKKFWPNEKPLGLRVSACDYASGGNEPGDLAQIINMVKHIGVDVVDVSSGGVVNSPVEDFPGYQLGFSRTIKEMTSLRTIGGGLVTDPAMADEAIRENVADLIFIGRELLRNPFWPLMSARTLGVDLKWPLQYERAKL